MVGTVADRVNQRAPRQVSRHRPAVPVWAPVAGLSAAGWAALAWGAPVAGHLGHLWLVSAMTAAMMGPFAAVVAIAAARASLWWQASSNAAIAVAGYLAVWLAVAAVTHVLGEAMPVPVVAGAWALGAVCAADALGRARRASLTRCLSSQPVRPARHWEDAARFGANTATRCVRLCLAPMALAALSPSVWVAAGATGLLVGERATSRVPRWLFAAGYLGLAALVVWRSPR